MEQNKAEDFQLGTLVLKTGMEKGYGVVVNRTHWIKKADKEDPRKVDAFIKHEVEEGEGFMIPIMWFGCVISTRLINKGGDISEEPYVERYTFSNVGGDIVIIPRFDRLETIISQMLLFYGGQNQTSGYMQDVRHDLEALKKYLAGDYDLDSPDLSSYYRDMIRLYEKAIPKHLWEKRFEKQS